MGRKIDYYMSILKISNIDNMNEFTVKKAYKKLVIGAHPDKKNGDSQKFIELTEAKDALLEFLSAKAFSSSVKNNNTNDDVWSWLGKILKKKDTDEINQAFRKMVGDVALRLFDAIGDDNMLRTYELFVKYKEFLCIHTKVNLH